MTNLRHGDVCPDLEMLSAYLDGKLDATLRGPIEDHISRCEDCYFVVRETAVTWAETGAEGSSLGGADAPGRGASVEGESGVVAPLVDAAAVGVGPQQVAPRDSPGRSLFTRYLLPIAATVIVGVGAVALWRESQANKDPRAALVEAVGQRRFFEARLTGGFRHGERISPKRGGGGADAEDWEVLAAAARIKKEVGSARDPRDVSTLAAAHLVLGEVDEAIRLLEGALAGTSPSGQGDASLLSDLSAAYLTRAVTQDRASDYPRALESASHAVRLDSTLREALFNKALALDSLHLPSQAAEAWDAFLAVESDPGWREEGRVRRSAPDSPPRSSDPASSRDELSDLPSSLNVNQAPVEDLDVRQARQEMEAALSERSVTRTEIALRSSVELARDYFEGTLLAPGADVTEQAARMRILGEAFERVTGDDVIAQTAVHLKAAAEPAAEWSALALYSEGRRNYLGTNWPGARSQLQAAVAELGRLRSPMWGWSRLYLAIMELQSGEYRAAEARLDPVVLESRASKQGGLLARSLYVRSILLTQRGDWDGALRDRTDSERAFDVLRDVPWAGFLAEQKGEVLSRLGRTALGWEGRIKALRSYRRFADSGRRVLTLLVIADDCRRAGQPHAAVEFLLEAKERVAAVPLVDTQAAVEFGLMTAWAAIDGAKAREHYANARGLVDEIADPIIRERTSGQLQRVAGEVAGIFGVEQSRLLDEAIAAFDREAPALALAPLLHRARLRVAVSNPALARLDLLEVLRRFDKAALAEGDLRWSGGALAAEAIEELVALDVAAAVEPVGLLRLVDDRAAILSGQPPGATTEMVGRAVAGLETDSAALVTLPLARSLLLFWIHDGAIQFRAVPLGREGVIEICRDFESELLSGVAPGGPSSRRLWALVIAPWAKDLDRVSRVFLISHGALAGVPLAYLAPADGISLLSRVEVSVVPRVSGLPRSGPVTPPSLIVFAAQRGGSSDLPALPAVSREVLALADTFQTLDVSGETPREILSRLEKGPAFHFAGHSLMNPDLPSESSLVLSPLPGRERYLRVRDIARSNLSRLELAVLAACSTADGGGLRGEERLGIAHAFLSAGAHSVLATLRPVSDAGTARIVREFYQALASSPGPAQALRSVQLGAPSDPDLSAFVVLSRAVHAPPGASLNPKES